MSSSIMNHDIKTPSSSSTLEGSTSSDGVGEDDALKLLQELRLSVQEPELSEKLMSINNQLQEDELLAMKSIYGDNIIILDNKSGLKCFQTHIHVELPSGICITSKDSTDFSSFRVDYIPPIILTCLLPTSYPSNLAPYFSISVQWLSSARISNLCSKLDSIWQEQPGQEVIYQWVEWLHGCTLSYLGFDDDEIVLGPYNGVRSNEDKRAISKSVSPDIDIPLLKIYNDEQRHHNFCIHECSICLSEFVGSEFIILPCQHFFCRKCVKTFVEMHITEGTVMKLQCPEPKCNGMVSPSLLKTLLGKDEFERWESMTLEKTLESMSDLFYCPRCFTSVCLGDGDNHSQCTECYYSFCTLCMDRRHVGTQCVDLEKKLLNLKERRKYKFETVDERQSRREMDKINQMLSLQEIKRFTKQCPSCKMAIYRSEGCNKMVCDNCGAYFCYACNERIDGYDHFSDGNCALYCY